MRPAAGTSPDPYSAAAYEAFVARGARRLPTIGSLSSVASTIGASRSQLYRYWETAADLDEAVTAHLATTRLGWCHHLRLDPDEPFDRAVARLVGSPDLWSGAAIWPAVASEPAGSALRTQVAAFERAYLARLAAHLERTAPVRPDHPVPWTDLAVMVAAVLHGAASLWAVMRSSPDQVVDDEVQDLLVDLISDLHGRYPSSVEGTDTPLAAAPGVELPPPPPDGAARLLDRIADAVAGGDLGPDPGDRRLVNVDDLARSLDVTPRHLFEVWPTPTDMNLAIAGEGFAHLIRGYDRLTDQLVGAMGAGDDRADLVGAMVELRSSQIQPSTYPEAYHQLALFAVAAAPDLAPAGRGVLRSWLLELGPRVSAAALQLTNRRLAPGRSLYDFGVQAGVKHVGFWQLVALHDGLTDRRVTFDGTQHPAVGVGLHLVPTALLDERD